MNHATFFNKAKASVFNGILRQSQVDGINAILENCDLFAVNDNRQRASILATPMIETGGTFIPVTENLNYLNKALTAKFGKRITTSQANQYGRLEDARGRVTRVANQEAIANIIYGGDWGLKQLGNLEPGDGWRFRGRGLAQITGRRNYEKLGKAIGVDLIKNPEFAATLPIAAKILVIGEKNGLFTGAKLDEFFNAKVTDWKNARKIINGLDKAEDLKAFSMDFYDAFKAAA